MKRLYVQHMILSGILILALGACVHKPTKTMKADIPAAIAAPPPQHVVLLQEARAETASLRGELASLKILMAKQMGELQALRKESQSVHQREQDQGLELQNIRSQLLSSQNKRNQLRKQNMELEGQVASMPDTSQLVSNIQGIRNSFQQIIRNMKGLASDISLIKQKMHIPTNTLKSQQTKLTKTQPISASPDKQHPDAKGRIIIQKGDTLWSLSQTYQVSVERLKEWNHMTSDLIMTGLHLQVAESQETVEGQTANVTTPATSSVPTAKQDNLKTPVQETPQATVDTHVDVPSEPTHILSIGNSQSDSHESP